MLSLYDMIRDDPNLLMFLPGQESTGTTLKDVSGNGRDGTLNGIVTLNGQTPFKFDPRWKSIGLADSSAYVATAFNPFTVGSDRTYELLLNRSSHASNYSIINDSSGKQQLFINTGSDFTWFADTGNIGFNWVAARAATDGTWGHIILTHADRSSNNGTAELILDGVSQGSHNPIVNFGVPTSNIQFGQIPGSIAFIAIYSYIMPPAIYKEHALAVVRKRLWTPNRTRLRRV